MTDQDSPEELQKQIDRLKKEKEKLDAERAKFDAQRGLDKAKQPEDSQLEALKKQKNLEDAKKDLANSQADAIKAQLFGNVTAGTFTGALEMKQGAGVAEANLLASHAIRKAGATIAAEVIAKITADLKPINPRSNNENEETSETDKTNEIYLFSVKDFPNFQRLVGFQFREELLKQAYATTKVGLAAEEAVATEGAVAAAPAIFSAGLDAFSKILGFLKADFSIGGIEIKPDDTQLLFAVAASLPRVHLPAIYNPKATKDGLARITEELRELVQLRGTADAEIKRLAAQIEHLEKGTGETERNKASDLKARVDLLKAVIALHDAFITSLNAPDTNGNLAIAVVAQELAIDDALQGGNTVLLLKLENAGGGYFVKKNLLTGFGAMPLYHMGGATASYVLLDGKEGTVLGANIVPVHGGFVRAGEVQDELKKLPQ